MSGMFRSFHLAGDVGSSVGLFPPGRDDARQGQGVVHPIVLRRVRQYHIPLVVATVPPCLLLLLLVLLLLPLLLREAAAAVAAAGPPCLEHLLPRSTWCVCTRSKEATSYERSEFCYTKPPPTT